MVVETFLTIKKKKADGFGRSEERNGLDTYNPEDQVLYHCEHGTRPRKIYVIPDV